MSRRLRCASSLFCHLAMTACFVALLLPRGARAQSGVNPDGSIDFVLRLDYTPTASDLTAVRNSVIQASRILWDASEGQLRLGKVELTCAEQDRQRADVVILDGEGRAYAEALNALAGPSQVFLYRMSQGDGGILAHELGHLALGLGDEYAEPLRFNFQTGNYECWGIGVCLEPLRLDSRNQCLMQTNTHSEFCMSTNHDLARGDGDLACFGHTGACGLRLPPPAVCSGYSVASGSYEKTHQSVVNEGRSCWEQLVANFSFLHAPPPPEGLPAADPPAGFPAPEIIDRCQARTSVMLVLDRSASMRWSVDRDDGEVCGDGRDNDGDGTVDELADCQESRLQFLKAAARAWLALDENRGRRAGVLSFNQATTLDKGLEEVNDSTLPGFNSVIGALTAGGRTAIGTALSDAAGHLLADAAADQKAIVLITDGSNTAGPSPLTVTEELRRQQIPVYAISTGDASREELLSRIAEETGGELVDSPSPGSLVNAFALQWGNFRNLASLLGRQSFLGRATNAFRVEAASVRLSFIIAGHLPDMKSFAVEASFAGPAGPGPSAFRTTSPAPNMRVVRDPFFLLVELTNLNPGDWRMTIEPGAGSSVTQRGYLTILADNPDFVLATRARVQAGSCGGASVTMEAFPRYETLLSALSQLSLEVRHATGLVETVFFPTNDTGLAEALGITPRLATSRRPLAPGTYEAVLSLRTGPQTRNHPGEPLWPGVPDNTRAVPVLERRVSKFFHVPAQTRPLANDSPAAATRLAGASVLGLGGGVISAQNSADYFAVDVPAEARLWATVDTGGSLSPAASTRDSLLTLLEADGVTVLEQDDNDGSGNGRDTTLESGDASAIAGTRQPSSGTVFVRVEAQGTNEAIMPYRLYLTYTTTPAVSEDSANDTPQTADPIVTSSSPVGVRWGTVGVAGDADYYSVFAPAGSLLHVSADGDPDRNGNNPNLIIDLLGPDGVTLLFSANSSGVGSIGSPPAEGFCYFADVAAVYFVRVRSVTGTAGIYQVMVARKGAGFSPLRLGIVREQGMVRLRVTTDPGRTYQLLSSPYVTGPWTPLPVTISGSGGMEQVLHPVCAGQEFFRAATD